MTTRLAIVPRPPPRPSDLAPPEPVFAWERLPDVLPEIAPLLRQHWREVDWFDGRLPLDPDWQRVLALDEAGVLRGMSVRLDGRLIGYIWSYLLPSPFFSVPWATVQGFWLDPVHRAGWLGVKLFKENERGLKALGAQAISVEILLKIASDRGTVGRILERLHYKPIGNLYSKVL